MALFVGAVLLPATGDDIAATLQLVREHDARWLAVALMFFGAGVGLLLGLPACLMLFPQRGRAIGVAGIAVMAVGAAGTLGYAMLLVFFRALALAEAIRVEAFDDVTADPGLNAFLYGWIGAFYLGELLLAVAVLRSRKAAPVYPLLLLAHIVLWPLAYFLPEELRNFTVILLVFGFCGLAFASAAEEQRLMVDTAPVGTDRPLTLG
jgi:hypothetical protein